MYQSPSFSFRGELLKKGLAAKSLLLKDLNSFHNVLKHAPLSELQKNLISCYIEKLLSFSQAAGTFSMYWQE